MASLVNVTRLADFLPFVMTVDETREAEGVLEFLSDDARYYGNPKWVAASVPREVENLIIRAAVRHMKNSDGFETSRAGDESVTWRKGSIEPGTAEFTKDEKVKLAHLAGRFNADFYSVEVNAWGTTDAIDNAVVQPYAGLGDERFPMFDTNEPW